MDISGTSLLAIQFLDKLNDSGVPIEQRHKLALKVFNSSNLPFNKKEEVVFSWITDIIKDNYEAKQKRQTFDLLEKCLSSPRIQEDEVELRPSVCEGIFEVLQTWGFHTATCSNKVSQKCTLHIIKCPIFYHYFKKNVSMFSKLIVAYFNSVTQATSLEDCAFISMFIFKLYNDTLLKRNFLTEFAKHILLSSVNALITLDEVSDSDFERNIYQSICKIFFSDQGAAESYVKGFRELQSDKDNPEFYAVVAKLLKLPKKYSVPIVDYVYSKFLRAFFSNTNDDNLKFQMFANLSAAIGYKPSEECIPLDFQVPKTFTGTTVLLSMLKVVNERNVSLDSEVNDVYLSSWLISLLYSFKKGEIFSTNLLKVIREVILLLDPIVAEQMISYFVEHVMLVKKNSDTIMSIYCDTLTDILDIFVKLSRIHNLISKILITLISQLTDPNNSKKFEDLTIEDIFPKVFCKKYSDAINTQPTVACFLVLNTLQHYFKKYVVNNELDKPNSTLMEILFELTTQVLQGTWIAEHTVPSAVKEKFICILDEYSEMLRTIGMSLVERTFNDQVFRSYFNLCGAWGAIHLMMVHYSYTDENPIEAQRNNDPTNLAFVLKFLPDVTWDILVKKTLRAGDTTTKYALFQLMEQKLAALREFEEGTDGPASVTAHFLLENADDDWLCEHANSLLLFLGPKELISFATILSHYKEQYKLIHLLQTVEFQESNDMVAAMGLALLADISRKCSSSGRTLMKKLFKQLLQLDVLSVEVYHVSSEEVKSNIRTLANILCDGIQEDVYKNDFLISPSIQRRLELLSGLPLYYLQPQTQVIMLLLLLASAKCLPYNSITYDIITGILDNQHPIELPETINWAALLQWIAENSKNYSERLILLKCLIKLAFRDSSSIGDLIHSLSLMNNESNIILCTIIATNLEKIIKRKRNIDGGSRSSLQSSCHQDLYTNIKNVTEMTPSLSTLPIFHIALQYHLNPKSIKVDDISKGKTIKMIPDYVDIILKSIKNIKENSEDSENSDEAYLEMEGKFFILIVQHRSKLNCKFPNEFISTSWQAMAGHLPVQKLQLFLQAATIEEFNNTLENLYLLTSKLLDDPSLDKKVCLLWKALAMAQLGCEKNVLRNNAVDHLYNTFLKLAFHWKESKNIQYIHSALVSLIASRQIQITIQHVEMCLEVVSATPSNTTPKVITKSLDILSALLKYRTDLITDMIPQFLQRFKYIISLISMASDIQRIQYPVQKLADCAFEVEKLSNLVVESGKHFARVAHFTVSDILSMFEKYTIEPSVKMHLQNAAFSFISLCDSHTIAHQMRILPPASQEIFKRIHNDYLKHHKFTGEV